MAEHDYYLGRDPSTDDLLFRHLRRTRGDQAVREDPMAKLQVTILRGFLDVLRAALDDENVESDTTRRVIERVIYGGVPSYVEVEERSRLQKNLLTDLRGED